MILLFHSLQSIAQYKISRLGIFDVGFRQFLASNHTLLGGGSGGQTPSGRTGVWVCYPFPGQDRCMNAHKLLLSTYGQRCALLKG